MVVYLINNFDTKTIIFLSDRNLSEDNIGLIWLELLSLTLVPNKPSFLLCMFERDLMQYRVLRQHLLGVKASVRDSDCSKTAHATIQTRKLLL